MNRWCVAAIRRCKSYGLSTANVIGWEGITVARDSRDCRERWKRGRAMGETPLLPLLRFLAYAARDDEALDLAEGALLVAEIAHPALDRARALRRLDAFAAAARAELGMDDGALLPTDSLALRTAAERVLAALRTVLAEREGFTGDQDDYYNPRNSFLSDVLDRRRGIPITLSVVYLEVARRLGAPLVGVGLPAHFLAKWPFPLEPGGALFVNAFDAS